MMGNNQNREGWRVGSRSKSIFGSAIDFAKRGVGDKRGKKGGCFERAPGCNVDRWVFSVCV